MFRHLILFRCVILVIVYCLLCFTWCVFMTSWPGLTWPPTISNLLRYSLAVISLFLCVISAFVLCCFLFHMFFMISYPDLRFNLSDVFFSMIFSCCDNPFLLLCVISNCFISCFFNVSLGLTPDLTCYCSNLSQVFWFSTPLFYFPRVCFITWLLKIIKLRCVISVIVLSNAFRELTQLMGLSAFFYIFY